VKLLTYVARRVLLSIPVLLGITFITFAISWEANEGHMERGYLTDKMTPAQRERVVEQYGFDKPFHLQYFSYLQRLASLDLGVSHVTGDRQILDVYGAFFPATIELSLVALVIAITGGIFLGTLSAIRKDAPVDHATRFLALAGVSVPVFWLGLLLKFAFATTYPVEIFSQGNFVMKGVVLTLAYGLPLLGGLFLAESLRPRRTPPSASRWSRSPCGSSGRSSPSSSA
jgi:peptide/nickel transport system permease protein